MSSESQNKEAEQDETYEVSLDEALNLAHGHHKSGNFILAERTYHDILRAVPDHFPTVAYLAVLLFQAGNVEEALPYIEKAVEVEPEDIECWTNYGGILVAAGEYEKALEALDKALELDENCIGAVNNKSYVYAQMQDYEMAKEMARKGLEMSPGNVDVLVNLGVAQGSLGEFEEAADTWAEAESLAPNNPVVLSNYGNTLLSLSKLLEAEEKCERALEIDGNSLDAMNNLGNVRRDMGDYEGAVELYTKVTDEKPDFHTAHYNKALAYFDMKVFSKALVSAKYALAFKEDDYRYYTILSSACMECNDFEQAHFAAQRAMKLAPEKSEPLLDMVNVLLRIDRYDDALAAMQMALKLEADTARVYMKLAYIYENLEDLDKALDAINKAIDIQPDMPAIQMQKVSIYTHMKKPEKALETLDEILATNPDFVHALVSKAETYIGINENEKAEELIEQVKLHTNKLPGIYGVLTSIKKMDELDEDFIAMKEVYEEICESGAQAKTSINYSMFSAYEAIKDYDAAFEYLKKGADNKREQVPYSPQAAILQYARIRSGFTAEKIKEYEGHGYEDSERAVLIVGMPRSGTTLTEQIISSHPQVHGAGELAEIGRAMKLQTELSKDTMEDIGRAYMEALDKLCPDKDIIRVTDKMPANFQNLGVIASALPNAKIIHCRRNPVDTCLSCYKQNFAGGQYWSYDLDELADEYLRYLDMMEYWREVLPGRFLEIDYEETVSNTEEQARKLIDHVGLEWDDACLEPHKQKRMVLTASRAQVTKPVYTSSVQAWKRYEKQLQPLVRKLLPEEALEE